jgi:raffinose/stachyose/melibiose transport system permease protein
MHIIVFLAPATLIYTLFMIYPLLDSLRLSLFTSTEEGRELFVGFQNYAVLLTDELWSVRFWGALKNNFVFFAVHTLVQNPVGLLLAALLSARRLRWRATYRTLLFTPTMLSVVIIGFIWQLILSPLWGIAGSVMDLVGLEQFFKPWLGLESSALVTLSLISVWQFVGIPMMLFYAALLGIPDELIEAAYVDGATGWTVFWRIKFPLILPTVGIVTILTYVGNFNAFDLIYTVQGALAGPNFSTDILGTFFYRTFFGFQLQLGNPTMGATIATMMFLIILIGVLLYLFVWQRRIQTYEI